MGRPPRQPLSDEAAREIDRAEADYANAMREVEELRAAAAALRRAGYEAATTMGASRRQIAEHRGISAARVQQIIDGTN